MKRRQPPLSNNVSSYAARKRYPMGARVDLSLSLGFHGVFHGGTRLAGSGFEGECAGGFLTLREGRGLKEGVEEEFPAKRSSRLRRTARAAAAGAVRAACVSLALVAEAGDLGDTQPRAFEITARKFQFEPAVVEVTQGERVRLTLRAMDGTHGFALKPFKVKAVIPSSGEPVTVEFVADKVGTFGFACSEYCGSGHSRMKGRLVVAKAR